jgi:hypothetical protein
MPGAETFRDDQVQGSVQGFGARESKNSLCTSVPKPNAPEGIADDNRIWRTTKNATDEI